ncbi:hypothetical protein HK098_002332 [Nowakowskiella sp. JEL0407]|nr:hypothetical protein HK098_002332 [Nowakowskiella sp. JEL0407]
MSASKSTSPLRIIVVGAGIAGTAFTLAMLRKPLNVDIVLCERDESENARKQGYTIALRQESIDVLINKLSCEAIVDMLYPDGSQDITLVRNGKVVLRGYGWLAAEINGKSYSSLVNRTAVRTALLKKIREMNDRRVEIKFGKKFVRYEQVEGGVKVYFDDGSVEFGDMVVGADGDRSKIRNQRCPELNPESTGIWLTMGSIPLSDVEKLKAENPDVEFPLADISKSSLARVLGREGSSFVCVHCYGSEKEKRLTWLFTLPSEAGSKHGLLPLAEDPTQSDKTAISKAAEVAEILTSKEVGLLVGKTPSSDFLKGFYINSVSSELMRQNPLQKDRKSRVTLIGDAAHKTTMNAGYGATAALRDSLNLAEHISEFLLSNGKDDIAVALRKFEFKMSKDAISVIEQSVSNTKRFHQTDPWAIAKANIAFTVIGTVMESYRYFMGSN